MDQIHHRDKPLERTAKLTAKAGPKPWDIKQYTYQEPIDDQRPLHGDPRLELELQSHGPHQTDTDFRPSDDYGYGHPAFGIGFTPEFDASASTASDQGTLAGGGCLGKPKPRDRYQQQMQREAKATMDYRIARREWEVKKTDTMNKRMERLRPR